jgi:hypothetical protein
MHLRQRAKLAQSLTLGQLFLLHFRTATHRYCRRKLQAVFPLRMLRVHLVLPHGFSLLDPFMIILLHAEGAGIKGPETCAQGRAQRHS